VTISTDDPAMEDLDLGLEYRRVAEAYGLEVEEMRMIALEGIESTWLDGSQRRELRCEFQAVPA
jgi:adenosine deaminase